MTTSTSLVTGVDFVTVPITDLDAAMQFYGEVLGMPCSVRYDRFPGAEYETGNLTLQLLDTGAIGLGFRPGDNHPIALQVEDVTAARAELESRGVSFEADTIDSGVCHMVPFKD